MLFFLVILAATVAIFVNATNVFPEVKIIGGFEASHGQFPFQVSIEYNGRQHCGGVILSPRVILTAAHCVYTINPADLTILAGSVNRLNNNDGIRKKIAHYIPHENYEPPPSTAYDIAIILLDEELPFSSTIQAAILPDHNEPIPDNVVAIVSGWGSEYHQGPTSYDLKFVHIPLWSRSQCMRYIPDLHSSHFCAGDAEGLKNSCPGDSGGPLSIGNKVIGIVSHGFGCGAFSRPAVYTYVGSFRDWIRKTANV